MNINMNRAEMLTEVIKAVGVEHHDAQNFMIMVTEMEHDIISEDMIQLSFAIIMIMAQERKGA